MIRVNIWDYTKSKRIITELVNLFHKVHHETTHNYAFKSQDIFIGQYFHTSKFHTELKHTQVAVFMLEYRIYNQLYIQAAILWYRMKKKIVAGKTDMVIKKIFIATCKQS